MASSSTHSIPRLSGDIDCSGGERRVAASWRAPTIAMITLGPAQPFIQAQPKSSATKLTRTVTGKRSATSTTMATATSSTHSQRPTVATPRARTQARLRATSFSRSTTVMTPATVFSLTQGWPRNVATARTMIATGLRTKKARSTAPIITLTQTAITTVPDRRHVPARPLARTGPHSRMTAMTTLGQQTLVSRVSSPQTAATGRLTTTAMATTKSSINEPGPTPARRRPSSVCTSRARVTPDG